MSDEVTVAGEPDGHAAGPATPVPGLAFHEGDCRVMLASLDDASCDAVVTDPPYGLSKEPDAAVVLQHWLAGTPYTHAHRGFMGKGWDSFVPGPEYWREVFRVLKPGGHALIFAGTRTADLMSIALRLAGFEIRDTLHWCYATGMPKSLNIGKAFDKAAGAEREVLGDSVRPDGGVRPNRNQWSGENGSVYAQDSWTQGVGGRMGGKVTAPATEDAKKWEGWGTALKPAHEPILVARKPLTGTVIANVKEHGTGGLNIDACRVPTADRLGDSETAEKVVSVESLGRWPANVVLSHASGCARGGECQPGCPVLAMGAHSGERKNSGTAACFFLQTYWEPGDELPFFYSPKASTAERNEGCGKNTHPTIKPLSLMNYLVRLVTPPGGLVLDPFLGSGTTAMACLAQGFSFVGVELEAEHLETARLRLTAYQARLQLPGELVIHRRQPEASCNVAGPDTPEG